MNRSMKELDYKTHPYSTCRLDIYNCPECERYYWEEMHPEFHDSDCDCQVDEQSAKNTA